MPHPGLGGDLRAFPILLVALLFIVVPVSAAVTGSGSGWAVLHFEVDKIASLKMRIEVLGKTTTMMMFYSPDGTPLGGIRHHWSSSETRATIDVGGARVGAQVMDDWPQAPGRISDVSTAATGVGFPPGEYVVALFTAGEVVSWRASLSPDFWPIEVLASGPEAHYRTVANKTSGDAVEVGAATVAVDVTRDAKLPFHIQHRLFGLFEDELLEDEFDPTVGQRYLEGPHGREECYCAAYELVGPDAKGPGDYVFTMDQVSAKHRNRPVAAWADIPAETIFPVIR